MTKHFVRLVVELGSVSVVDRPVNFAEVESSAMESVAEERLSVEWSDYATSVMRSEPKQR